MAEAQRIGWVREPIRHEGVRPVKLLLWPRGDMLLAWTKAVAVEFSVD